MLFVSEETQNTSSKLVALIVSLDAILHLLTLPYLLN